MTYTVSSGTLNSTIPFLQGNQELLAVIDEVGRPPLSLRWASPRNVFCCSALTLLVWQQEHRACEKFSVRLFVVTIWLEFYTPYSSICHQPTPSSLAPIMSTMDKLSWQMLLNEIRAFIPMRYGTESELYYDQAHECTQTLLSPCVSLSFNAHSPAGPQLARTRMSPFWILL